MPSQLVIPFCRQGVHVSSRRFVLRANEPTVVPLRNLEMGRSYLCYFGGVRAEDCLGLSAMWRHNPPTVIVATSAGSVACATTAAHDARAHVWGWDALCAELSGISLHTVAKNATRPHEYGNDKSGGEEENAAATGERTALFAHLGGLIDVREKLAMLFPPLLDALTQDHVPVGEWERLLDTANGAVKREFRSILTQPAIRLLFRSTSCVILPGNEESGVCLFASTEAGSESEGDCPASFQQVAWHFVANCLRKTLRLHTRLYLRQLYTWSDQTEASVTRTELQALDRLLFQQMVQQRSLHHQQSLLEHHSTTIRRLEQVYDGDAAEIKSARQAFKASHCRRVICVSQARALTCRHTLAGKTTRSGAAAAEGERN